MKYWLDVRETIDLTFEVEAESEEEAIEKFEAGQAVEVGAWLDDMDVRDVYVA